MPIREPHPFGGQPIHVRRRDLGSLRVVRVHVAVAEIICEDDDDVGRGAKSDDERRRRSSKCFMNVSQCARKRWQRVELADFTEERHA